MQVSALCAVPTGYILDAVILVGLLIFILICRKRGFIKMFFRFASGLVSVVVAITLAKTVLSATDGLFGLQEHLSIKFTETFSKLKGFDMDISGQDVGALLASGEISTIIATLVAKKYAGVELATGTTLGYLAGTTVAELCCALITGIVLYFGLKIVCRLLGRIFTVLIKKINLLNRVNSILGMVVGFIEAVFVISLLISILTLIPSTAIVEFFNGSLVLRFLYNHNPIVWVLGLLL